MKIGVSPVERAFQLARSGQVANVDEIKKALKFEGYSVAEIDGSVIHKQLRAIIKVERAKRVVNKITVEGLKASNDE